MRKSYLAALICMLLGAVPALAGTVYVPVASNTPFAGKIYETHLWASNPTTETLEFRSLFIPAGTDGTSFDRENLQVTRVAPKSTLFMENLVPEGQEGVLEIDADAALVFHSEVEPMLGNQPGSSARIPVVSSENMIRGGDRAQLLGLVRTGGGTVTNVGILNLTTGINSCTAAVFLSNGTQVGGTVGFDLPALGNANFDAALGLLGLQNVKDVRVELACEGDFYPWATVFGNQPNETLFVSASQSGDSDLGGADTTPPVSGSICAPGGGGVVCEIPGTFFTPNAAHGAPVVVNDLSDLQFSGRTPTMIVNLPVEGTTRYGSVTVEVDFEIGGWSQDPRENHSVFWLNRNSCCSPWPRWMNNVFGFVNAFGPGRNTFKNMTNAGVVSTRLPHGSNVNWELGVTYRAVYTYDANRGRSTLELFRGGNLVTSSSGQARANAVRSDDGFFMIYFGHEDGSGHGPERPSIGWNYSNLRVEFNE